jgi:hypothetical protein
VPFEACQAHDFATPQAKSRTVATNAPPTRTTSCSALAARSTLWWTAETSPRHQFDEPVDGRLGDCAFPGDAPVAKYDDPGRDVDDLVRLVADEDEGKPGPDPLPHIVTQLPGALQIK